MHFVETVVLAGSGIGVDHREQDSRKIEHCDVRGQLAHVYKATLAVLHHDIVDIEVAVHAAVAVGNEVEKAMQIPSFLFADPRDVCLRCCFLRNETLFSVAAPCGFFYSLRKPFLSACMKTAVLSTAVSLCLRSGVLDVSLRCCFLRNETLFRVAAPCGFFYSLRKPFLPACMKTAVLSTAVLLCLRSWILDVCLRCCFLRNETLFRVAAPCGFFTACASRFYLLV